MRLLARRTPEPEQDAEKRQLKNVRKRLSKLEGRVGHLETELRVIRREA